MDIETEQQALQSFSKIKQFYKKLYPDRYYYLTHYNNNKEIKQVAYQKIKQKYQDNDQFRDTCKNKSREFYHKNKSDPEFVNKQRQRSREYYAKCKKNDPNYRKRLNEKAKVYYHDKKKFENVI